MNSYNSVHPEQTASKSNQRQNTNGMLKGNQFAKNFSSPLKCVRRFPGKQIGLSINEMFLISKQT